MQAKEAEDASCLTTIEKIGGTPHFAGDSVTRELAIIAGEEACSEVCAWAGGGVGLLFAGWGAVPGAILGRIGGDYAGGAYSSWQYDRSTRMSDEEIQKLYYR